ncbi:MAG: class I SAM-dependent methyltransferase [Flavobacteriales bacterium]|nr:class I SAM-dependent methyltransferase [Flavobacteriales bacterium]
MRLYGKEYALMYDKMWIDNPKWLPEMKYIQSIISENLKPGIKWLDVGCGTGFFLKKFKGIQRAGFDISEEMLEVAKLGNEDCLFLIKHNVSEESQEWNNQWDFISCTGQPWSYLNSINDIEKFVLNLYNWCSLSGKILLIPDDVQIAFNINYKYNFDVMILESKSQVLNAVIWTFKDELSTHKYMIYPMLDQWVRWFSIYFKRVDILSKKFDTHTIPRTYLILSEKRDSPEMVNADIFINHKNLRYFIEKYGIDNLNNETLFMN